MNKQNIFTVLFSLLLSVGSAVATVAYLEKDKLIQSSPHISQLRAESVQNSDMIKQLSLSVSKLKETVYDLKAKPAIQMAEPPASQSSDIEQLKIVMSQLANMQQQINDFKQSIISLEGSKNSTSDLPATVSVSKDEILRQREELNQKSEILQQQTLAMYEDVLNSEPKDVAWGNDLEDGIKKVIELNESFSDAQLKDVNCQGSLCRVTLSASKSPIFVDDIISSFGEGVSTYMQTEEETGDTTFYVSRKGEDLPRIDGIN